MLQIKTITLTIFFWGILNLTLSLLSFYKIKQNKKQCEFIYFWGSLFGAFVWEDLFIFALYNFLTVIAAFLLTDLRVILLTFIVFWVVRSAGETLYFFLQQFIEPKHHPHNISNHFNTLKKLFGNISEQKCMIIMQVCFQLITVTSLVALIYLLKNWTQLSFLT